jgi:hypothetical protein
LLQGLFELSIPFPAQGDVVQNRVLGGLRHVVFVLFCVDYDEKREARAENK